MQSLHLSFLHWIKESVELDEERLITKSFAGCFLLLVEGSQSSLNSVWTGLACCKSLFGELSSAITLILMRLAGNSHSAETSKIDSSHGRVTG